ncbi:MAG: alpha/beta hydrolase [Gammaproteobacteria bacterium]|nr:alpha/beta hydrolase [Gammaproteobacteria bacterium]
MATSRMAFFDGVAFPGADLPDPHYLPPPPAWLALTEFQRVVIEAVSLTAVRGLLADLPSGDGHPVMVLPGFLGSDGYNSALRRFLAARGYAVHGWGLGTNLGPRGNTTEKLLERLDFLYTRYGQALSLVGHSLGGIFARELAREAPEQVRQVVSLGSPFGRGRSTGSHPARLFHALNPDDEIPIAIDELHWAPPVPTTSVYSKGDGIVNWRTAVQSEDFAPGITQNIQVRGSHCGMTLNPVVWFILADRLRQARDNWQPFSATSLTRLLVPRHS